MHTHFFKIVIKQKFYELLTCVFHPKMLMLGATEAELRMTKQA